MRRACKTTKKGILKYCMSIHKNRALEAKEVADRALFFTIKSRQHVAEPKKRIIGLWTNRRVSNDELRVKMCLHIFFRLRPVILRYLAFQINSLTDCCVTL